MLFKQGGAADLEPWKVAPVIDEAHHVGLGITNGDLDAGLDHLGCGCRVLGEICRVCAADTQRGAGSDSGQPPACPEHTKCGAV